MVNDLFYTEPGEIEILVNVFHLVLPANISVILMRDKCNHSNNDPLLVVDWQENWWPKIEI